MSKYISSKRIFRFIGLIILITFVILAFTDNIAKENIKYVVIVCLIISFGNAYIDKKNRDLKKGKN